MLDGKDKEKTDTVFALREHLEKWQDLAIVLYHKRELVVFYGPVIFCWPIV